VIAVPLVLAISGAFAYAIGRDTRNFNGMPLLWFLVAQAFLIQFIAYVPAILLQTEKFYDLVGSLTFLSVVVVAMATNSHPSVTQYVAAGMIAIWAVRLGSFLFLRAVRGGGDSRFDEIKKSWSRFLVAWTLQGLWVVMLTAPLMVVMSQLTGGLGPMEITGMVVWVVGMATEVVADRQKSLFVERP
jgi:steroid 5-alpha reductase family enzyme